MDAWVWIVIAVVVVLLVVAAIWYSRNSARRIAKRRAQAQELRQEASAGFGRAQERQALADEQGQRAERERVAAQRAAERAQSIDPDSD
jgi:FtsZ-interacting cell division protein ZipA